MENSNVGWLPASEIGSNKKMDTEWKNYLNNSHIYAICKTPKLSFDINTFSYQNGIISGDIFYKINGKQKSFSFKEEMPLYDGATKIKISDYPHSEIITLDDNNKKIRHFPAHVFTLTKGLHTNIPELRNLEILYIGQSYSSEGNRTVLDRLQSHSTLQKILVDVHNLSPDDEVNVLLFTYEPCKVVTHMDGCAKSTISDYRDIDRFRNILKNPLTKYQQVCLIEAGLIRYFQPKYNKIYKDSFPSEKHKILEDCYSLDFSALILSIEADKLGFTIYSEERESQYTHYCNIELTNPEERFGFFHFTNENGTITKVSNVIRR